MAEKLGTAVLELITTDKKFRKEIKQALKETEKLDKKFDDTKRKAKIAFGAVVVAVAAVGVVVKQLISAYREQEQAEAQFIGALRATGTEATISAQAMFAYAAELQQVTLFGDEATISAMALLQSLADVGEKGLRTLMPLIQDFSSAMGVSLNTATALVGKTLGSTTNALTRYGVEVDMTGTKAEKLVSLTTALEEKFGGMAAVVADTATGAITQLGNAMGDLREEGGMAIAEFMEPTVRWLTGIIQKAATARQRMRELKKLMTDEGWDEATSTYESMVAALNKLAGEAATIREEMKTIDVRLIFMKKKDLAELEERMEILRRKLREVAIARGVDADAATAAAAAALKAADAAARLAAREARYSTALETMAKIIETNKTEYEKLGETLEFLESFTWAEDQTFQLELQADAIEIVLAKMAALSDVGEELIVVYDEFGRVLEQATINMANLSGLEARGGGTDRQLPSAALPGAAGGGAAGMGGLAAVAQALTDAFMGIASIAAVADPLATIFEAMAAVLEPFVNTALAPLVGLLTIMGQMLGQMLIPIIAALAPILQDLVSVVASFLMPALILLETPIAIVTAALEFLQPIIEVIAKGLDQLARPVEILAVVFGALMSWVVALGKVIGYIVTFQWDKIGSVAPGASFSDVINAIEEIITRPPLEFGEQLADAGADVLEDEPGFEGSGGGGGGATFRQQRPITVEINILEAQVYGGSLREFAIMIREELLSITELGL